MKLKVSLAQIDISLGNPDENLKRIQEKSRKAAEQGSDIIVFPELWSSGYDLENAGKYASALDQGFFAKNSLIAKEYGIYTAGSSLSLMGPEKYGNTIAFFDREGKLVNHYSKVHLFKLMNEHQYLDAGNELIISETPWGKFGFAICYDLRFPELFRAYALAGVKVVFLPAEWPHPRLAHWRTLLRARAIENQMYIVACNRVGGDENSHDFCGHSAVIDPWGDYIVEGGETEELLTAEIQMDKVDKARETIPVFKDRRPDIYRLT